jgi:hypothetical protein
LRVFLSSLAQDRDVGIGVLPKRKKFLVRRAGFDTVALQRVGSPQFEMGQRSDGFVQHNAPVVQDLAELRHRFVGLSCGKVCFSAHVNRVQVRPVIKTVSR